MDYSQFKKEWKEEMVYKPNDFKSGEFEQLLNDFYTDYKKAGQQVYEQSVKDWCKMFFADCDMDTHPYMLKNKAINSKHGDSLRKLCGAKVWKWEDIQKNNAKLLTS